MSTVSLKDILNSGVDPKQKAIGDLQRIIDFDGATIGHLYEYLQSSEDKAILQDLPIGMVLKLTVVKGGGVPAEQIVAAEPIVKAYFEANKDKPIKTTVARDAINKSLKEKGQNKIDPKVYSAVVKKLIAANFLSKENVRGKGFKVGIKDSPADPEKIAAKPAEAASDKGHGKKQDK